MLSQPWMASMSIAWVVMCIKCISSIGHCGFSGVNTRRPRYLIRPSHSHECFQIFGDVIPPKNCLMIASEILIADKWYCSVVMASAFCKNAVWSVIKPSELIISRSNEGNATKSNMTKNVIFQSLAIEWTLRYTPNLAKGYLTLSQFCKYSSTSRDIWRTKPDFWRIFFGA